MTRFRRKSAALNPVRIIPVWHAADPARLSPPAIKFTNWGRGCLALKSVLARRSSRGGVRSSGACPSSHSLIRSSPGVPKKYRNEASPSEDTFWGRFGVPEKYRRRAMQTEDTFWGRAPSQSWLMGVGNGSSRGGMHSFGACPSSHTLIRSSPGVPKKYRNEASPSEDTFWGSGGGEGWEG